MTPSDLYLQATINRHLDPDSPIPAHLLRRLRPQLQSWSSAHLESVTISGSHAKATALRGSDIDLFLSLAPSTPAPLAAIQPSLAAHFRYYSPEIRNVSVRIRLDGHAIDLVPGRRRENSTAHTLWQSRQNTWIQADITEQIRRVRTSGLQNEIRALKIWAQRNSLRFQSFVQEQAVFQAVTPGHPISESFLEILHLLAASFPHESLTPQDQDRISQAARKSITSPTWPEIL